MGSGCNPCRKSRKLAKESETKIPDIRKNQGIIKSTLTKQKTEQSKDFFKKVEQSPTLNSNIMYNMQTKDEKSGPTKEQNNNLKKSHVAYGSKKQIPSNNEKKNCMTSKYKEEDNSMKRCRYIYFLLKIVEETCKNALKQKPPIFPDEVEKNDTQPKDSENLFDDSKKNELQEDLIKKYAVSKPIIPLNENIYKNNLRIDLSHIPSTVATNSVSVEEESKSKDIVKALKEVTEQAEHEPPKSYTFQLKYLDEKLEGKKDKDEEKAKDNKEEKQEKSKNPRLVSCGSYKPAICKNVLLNKKPSMGIKQNYEKGKKNFPTSTFKEEKIPRKSSAFSPHISTVLFINHRHNAIRKII